MTSTTFRSVARAMISTAGTPPIPSLACALSCVLAATPAGCGRSSVSAVEHAERLERSAEEFASAIEKSDCDAAVDAVVEYYEQLNALEKGDLGRKLEAVPLEQRVIIFQQVTRSGLVIADAPRILASIGCDIENERGMRILKAMGSDNK